MKRDEVERRVKEDEEEYSDKFCEDSKAMCRFLLAKDHTQVGAACLIYNVHLNYPKFSPPINEISIVTDQEFQTPNPFLEIS